MSDHHGPAPRADPARGVRSAGGPAVAALRRLRPRRGGGAVGGRRGAHRLAPRRSARPARAPGSRSRRSATRWTPYAGPRGSAPSPRGPSRPAEPERPGTDDRLALLFACCHPALAPEARLALTLRAVVGLTTPQIARAFLVNETHPGPADRARQAQDRHRRHRAGGAAAGRADRAARRRARRRLRDVQRGLRVLDRRHPGPRPGRRRRVAGRRGRHQPAAARPRPGGWPRCSPSSTPGPAARFDESGDLVLLRDQDRVALGPRGASPPARRTLERAAALHAPGRYQLQAAIAACHASSPSWEETDWLQIVTLYDLLPAYDPSPVVAPEPGRRPRPARPRPGRGWR